MTPKSKRQCRIKEILDSKFISSLDDMLKILAMEEDQITQATLSRDFASMGVVRISTDKGPRYILSAEESGRSIEKLIGLEILSVRSNETLVIVKTLAGRAQGVAHYIDRLEQPEILGSIAGDDTVMVIPSSIRSTEIVVEAIQKIMARNH